MLSGRLHTRITYRLEILVFSPPLQAHGVMLVRTPGCCCAFWAFTLACGRDAGLCMCIPKRAQAEAAAMGPAWVRPTAGSEASEPRWWLQHQHCLMLMMHQIMT